MAVQTMKIWKPPRVRRQKESTDERRKLVRNNGARVLSTERQLLF